MAEKQSADVLKDLVKFIIALAILGTVLALLVYLIVILPHASAVAVPSNYVYPGIRPTVTPVFFQR